MEMMNDWWPNYLIILGLAMIGLTILGKANK